MDSGTSSAKPDALKSWPPLEGRYDVGNKKSPVAVCTMASVDIKLPMNKIAIAGKCVTENLGIEKIVKNVVSNPNIRYIIVAGRESMGHFVDNALESLVSNGVDDEGRIIGAKGGIPVLKNLTRDEIERFRKQVEIVNMAGVTDAGKIMERVEEYYGKAAGAVSDEPVASSGAERLAVPSHPISEWTQDPHGYFTIHVSHEKGEIVVEHHENSGKITVAMTGRSAEDLYHYIINKGLVSRLDHAAYLGRELGKAETALFNKTDYEQDTGLVIPSAVSTGERIGTDGKELVPLPSHGKLISVKKIEKTRETILTYLVNDREFPIRSQKRDEEDRFKEFLKECGMCRVF